MKNGRFEVGDTVVANDKASSKYCITVSGWIGKVTDVISDDYDIENDHDTIRVSGPGGDWWVNHKYFDLRKNCITIDGVSLPECCGICFAYNNYGCAFVNLDKSTDIWKERAKNCPMKEG